MKPYQFVVIIAALALIAAGVWYPTYQREQEQAEAEARLKVLKITQEQAYSAELERRVQGDEQRRRTQARVAAIKPFRDAVKLASSIKGLEFPWAKEEQAAYFERLETLEAGFKNCARDVGDPPKAVVMLECATLIKQGHDAMQRYVKAAHFDSDDNQAIKDLNRSIDGFNAAWPIAVAKLSSAHDDLVKS